MAKRYKIHPAIGIARLGNSETMFVGPRIPGVPALPPDGNFKKDGKVKRQAAEFRVFEYDDANLVIPPVEVTMSDNVKITWTVKLANRKAAADRFLQSGPRNPVNIPDSDLIIAPDPLHLDTPGRKSSAVNGKFRGKPVKLGRIETDAMGRLRVVGGAGDSGFVLKGNEIGGYEPPDNATLDFANNQFWYDDTSDGSVAAKIKIGNAATVEADPAWVIVAPPDFAPPVGNAVSLLDAIYDVLVRHFQFNLTIYDRDADPSFNQEYRPHFIREIYPILAAAIGYRSVHKRTNTRHKTLMRLEDLSKEPLPDGTDPHIAKRRRIFNRMRDPEMPDVRGRKMPLARGDLDSAVYPQIGLTLTRTQYELFRKWKDGKFEGVDNWQGPPTPSTQITPEGMDRAALENCVGGSFSPGIELGRIVVQERDRLYVRDDNNIAHEIRLKGESVQDGRIPGYLTANMAVPWQADFWDCSKPSETGQVWWPGQRPDDVIRPPSSTPKSWTQGIVNNHRDMVEKWSQLGFVKLTNDALIEDERQS